MPDLSKHYGKKILIVDYLTPATTHSPLLDLASRGQVKVNQLMVGLEYDKLPISTAILVIVAIITTIEAQQRYLIENPPVKKDKNTLAVGGHFEITAERAKKLGTLKKELKSLHTQKSALIPANLNPQIRGGGNGDPRRK